MSKYKQNTTWFLMWGCCYALSRTHILQVMFWGGFVSLSFVERYILCGYNYPQKGKLSFLWKKVYIGLGNNWLYVKIWPVWLTVNEKLFIRKQEANIVISVRRPNCLVNVLSVSIPALSVSSLCFTSVCLISWLTRTSSTKQLCQGKHCEARSVPGTQKFGQLCCWLQAKLDFIFWLLPPSHLLFVSIFWEWSFDLPY